MNFYELLVISKQTVSKRFSDLTLIEVNRLQKQLRLEHKMNSNASSDEFLFFIKALESDSKGLDFLFDNQNFTKAIFQDKPKFTLSERRQTKAYSPSEIQDFFSKFLHTQLNSAIGEAYATDHYTRLQHITRYHKYIPNDIVMLLKSRLKDKLQLIELKVNSGVFSAMNALDKLNEILILLGDQNLIEHQKRIQNIAFSKSLDIQKTPGLIYFFQSLGEFFSALATTPKNVIEKEKKQETLKGCGWVFMVVAIIFVSCLVFIQLILPNPNDSKIAKQYPGYDKRSSQFTKYLTNFERKDVLNYTYVGPIYRGYVLNNQFDTYPDLPLTQGPRITNNSSYDLIIFSKKNLFPMEDTPNAAAVYIKSGNSGYAGSFYLNRLYYGDSLARFNTRYDSLKSTVNRFLVQPSFSKEAIEYGFTPRGRSPIEIRDTLDRVILDGKGVITIHQPNGKKETIALPILFPYLDKH